MIAYDALPAVCNAAFVSSSQPFGGSLLSGALSTTALRRMAHEVSIGETTYRLREPLTLTFYPFVHDGLGELIPEPARPEVDRLDVAGVGVSIEDAYSDWVAKLHVRVQTLLAKRPWEMNHDEVKEMAAIERMIDLPAYHNETPVRVRQIGTVVRSRPIPDRIRWEDGHVEPVLLDQMPTEFAAFMSGQRFESISLRDSTTGRLLRVVHVARLPRLPSAPEDEWGKVPTFSDSPKVGWDEID